MKKLNEPATTKEVVADMLDISARHIKALNAPGPEPVPDEQIKRYNRLKANGFTNHPDYYELQKQMQRFNDQKAHNKEANEILDHQRFYEHHYPQYPFVPYQSMNDLLNRYMLYLASTRSYTGEIPDWVLELMDAVRISSDYLVNPEWGSNGNYLVKPNGSPSSYGIIAPITDFTKEAQDRLRSSSSRIDAIPVSHDPIIVARVRKGFLIVAAWGAEVVIPGVVSPRLT